MSELRTSKECPDKLMFDLKKDGWRVCMPAKNGGINVISTGRSWGTLYSYRQIFIQAAKMFLPRELSKVLCSEPNFGEILRESRKNHPDWDDSKRNEYYREQLDLAWERRIRLEQNLLRLVDDEWVPISEAEWKELTGDTHV